jgi:hypothetical protein
MFYGVIHILCERKQLTVNRLLLFIGNPSFQWKKPPASAESRVCASGKCHSTALESLQPTFLLYGHQTQVSLSDGNISKTLPATVFGCQAGQVSWVKENENENSVRKWKQKDAQKHFWVGDNRTKKWARKRMWCFCCLLGVLQISGRHGPIWPCHLCLIAPL